MKPAFTVTANGQDATAVMRDRLLSLAITDEAGWQAVSLGRDTGLMPRAFIRWTSCNWTAHPAR